LLLIRRGHPGISLFSFEMSYQVIARKYRPQRFADVVGQEHVTQTLSNAITQKRIAHAYLFVGPRGTGKTTIARIFAKCLNCTNGPAVDFPDDDPRAREITEGRSMDVMEIDGASNRGIDEVRELRETVKYAPASSRFKIYIIDEVHMLTKEAFNALLKTLEEPPAHVKFMFATTEADKVLPTILSRCQRFDLRRIPSALIVQHLASIAKQEKVQIDEAALYAIARGADGGMRDAESTLDQLISFCGTEIAEADVLSMFGLAARSQILALGDAVLAGDAEAALRQLNDLAQQGKDIARLVSELLSHFRNLLIFQVSRGDLRLIEASEAEIAALRAQSGRLHTDAVTRVLEVLTDCEGRLRDSTSRKILVEVTLLKMIEARNAVSIDTVLKQVQQLRAEAAGGAPKAATPKPVSAPPPAVSMTSSPRSDADLQQLWAKLVDAVGRASPFVRSYFVEAHPVSFETNVLTIGFDPEFADHLPLVDNSKNHALVQTKLAELGHAQAQVKFIRHDAPVRETPPAPTVSTPSTPSKPPPQPAAPPEHDFKNDPLIQKALEVFKGRIVDVRS
jgi:DNA polymerase III subunit gamma/tau